MDLNIVVIAGRLASEPEVKEFASGAVLVRLLVSTKQELPHRRVDVIPVAVWDPDQTTLNAVEGAAIGDRVWVSATMQRRFWATDDGRRSRLEVIGKQVQVRPLVKMDATEGVVVDV